MRKQHPEIPPNCPFFGKNRDDDAFDIDREFWTIDSMSISSSQCWRKIVAAVARCAWLDEHLRRWDEVYKKAQNASRPLGTDDVEFIRIGECAMNAAKNNAELWRVWGQQ